MAELDVRKVSEVTQVITPDVVDSYEFVVLKAAKEADGTVVSIVDDRATERTRTTVVILDAQIAKLQEKKDAIIAYKLANPIIEK